MTFSKLTSDGYILFGTRAVRMFAYGFLSVVLVLYLAQLGLSQGLIGLLLSLTLFGDSVISPMDDNCRGPCRPPSDPYCWSCFDALCRSSFRPDR